MYQVPVNRWTVGAVVALLSIFGGDLIAPILKVFAVLSAPYTPAI
jgi:hypothetical protein